MYFIFHYNFILKYFTEYQIQNITSILSRDFECEQGMKIGFNGDGSLRTLYDPFNKVCTYISMQVEKHISGHEH